MSGRALTDRDYKVLAAFRCELRGFLARSETIARGIGVPPQQHQALLAVRGYDGEEPMTVGALAECLFIKHHTTVELVDRLVDRGLLTREEDPHDRRRITLRLTPQAHGVLAELTEAHVEEIHRLAPLLKTVLEQVAG